jgi:ribulose-5-phosphate 4-epimerase/fuculose-1-phosphate aldolase
MELATEKPVASKNADQDMSSHSVRGVQEEGSVPTRSIRDEVSEAEWNTRVDLAAAYRLMVRYGMTDMIYNHITARVPGSPDEFLINAYGLHYSEINASNLHRINHDGEITLRGNTHYGINFPGFVIHGAIHEARSDVNCIIHSHTRSGVAVSAMKVGLLPLSLLGMRYSGHIGYHDCEGTVVQMDERVSLVRDLGSNNAMMLRNHGLLACGPTIAEAFNSHYMLDQACKIQVDAMSSGAELVMPPPKVVEETARLFEPNVRRAFGVMEWGAMIRLLDREDPSYKN